MLGRYNPLPTSTWATVESERWSEIQMLGDRSENVTYHPPHMRSSEFAR